MNESRFSSTGDTESMKKKNFYKTMSMSEMDDYKMIYSHMSAKKNIWSHPT